MLNSVFSHNKFFFKIDILSGDIIVTKCSRKMEYIACQDINNFLYSISIKYNIDLDVLRDRYLPIITIEKKKIQLNAQLHLENLMLQLHNPIFNAVLENGIMVMSRLMMILKNGLMVHNAPKLNMEVLAIAHSTLS